MPENPNMAIQLETQLELLAHVVIDFQVFPGISILFHCHEAL